MTEEKAQYDPHPKEPKMVFIEAKGAGERCARLSLGAKRIMATSRGYMGILYIIQKLLKED